MRQTNPTQSDSESLFSGTNPAFQAIIALIKGMTKNPAPLDAIVNATLAMAEIASPRIARILDGVTDDPGDGALIYNALCTLSTLIDEEIYHAEETRSLVQGFRKIFDMHPTLGGTSPLPEGCEEAVEKALDLQREVILAIIDTTFTASNIAVEIGSFILGYPTVQINLAMAFADASKRLEETIGGLSEIADRVNQLQESQLFQEDGVIASLPLFSVTAS